jgi:short-subunit dehydrogenase
MLSTARPAAIITGASSGIGAACAAAFAQAGIDVVLTARRQDRLGTLAEQLVQTGAKTLAVAADVTDESAMRMVASRALATFGRVDLLVCSAGLGFQGLLEETTPEVVHRLLSVNVVGTLNAARAVLPYFEAQRAGHLIVVCSIVGRRGIPGYAAYSAAKFAQAGLAEALRAELRGSGVAVTTVFPVSVASDFRDAMTREFGIRVQGRGPIQSAEQIARAILRVTHTRAPELYPLRRARALVWLSAFAPALADRVARRFARTRGGDETSPAAPDHDQ